MYQVLRTIGRDVRGCTNFTCVQLNIPSTWVIFSPAGSSDAFVWTFEEVGITPEFN